MRDTCEGCKFNKVQHIAEYKEETIYKTEYYGFFGRQSRQVEVKPWIDLSHDAYDRHFCYADPKPIERTTTKPGEFPPACTKKQT